MRQPLVPSPRARLLELTAAPLRLVSRKEGRAFIQRWQRVDRSLPRRRRSAEARSCCRSVAPIRRRFAERLRAPLVRALEPTCDAPPGSRSERKGGRPDSAGAARVEVVRSDAERVKPKLSPLDGASIRSASRRDATCAGVGRSNERVVLRRAHGLKGMGARSNSSGAEQSEAVRSSAAQVEAETVVAPKGRVPR